MAASFVRQSAIDAYLWLTHLIGRVTGKYYFEDYVRVYPDDIVYNRFGLRSRASDSARRNYLNHLKFYRFAAQFVNGRSVVDIGCGSGYGTEVLRESGATRVAGCDISKPAIQFAKTRYGTEIEFAVRGITDLSGYANDEFDVVTCSEVLEHVKEYDKEADALAELKRITAPGGLVIAATPNSELLGAHGFYFAEIDDLFRRFFEDYVVFENAFVPYGPDLGRWKERLARGDTGVIVSQSIAIGESVLPDGVKTAELKAGIAPGSYDMNGTSIDTRLLHNTHSWIVVARK